MAAFPLPPGHPFTNVRPGYIGFESTPLGSIVSATASYVGAVGDYPNNTITLQLFATMGGVWNITTPGGLTNTVAAANGQASTAAVYTGGTRGSTYTFPSITLTTPQGTVLTWTGPTPSVTLAVPTQVSTILSGYYIGGDAIYLTPSNVSSLFPLVQGITDYVFSCPTPAGYVSVDSTTTGAILFPTGASFTPGTTTTLNIYVSCRSNGILGGASPSFPINIVQPAIPTLTGTLVGSSIRLDWTETTNNCIFNLSTGGSVYTNVTSPYSYSTSSPGNYTFSIQATLCGFGTYSSPVTTTVYPIQPTPVSYTVSGLTVSFAWTSPVGTGYSYTVSATGLTLQTVTNPTATFTGVGVGSTTFYIQSVYAGVVSTTCNVQVSVNTTPPYSFTPTVTGSTIALAWACDTPGATFNITSTLGNQNTLTTKSYSYTSVPGGTYSFSIVAISGGNTSTSTSTNATVSLVAPTNFTVTTLSSTATLNWQEATIGASFNISYSVASISKSKTITSNIFTTTISSLPAGNYTFGIQSVLPGGTSSSFVNADATIIADPTNFKAIGVGSTISLSWVELTTGCSFFVSNATLGTKNVASGTSNVQYTGVAVGGYNFSLTPSNTTSFIGATVLVTASIVSVPVVTATLAGLNVNLSWPAITGCSYTVSSSPGVPSPPSSPGTTTNVQFLSPPPGTYTFSVTATDGGGNISTPGTSGSVTVPVAQPTSVTMAMTASSQLTVQWTENTAGCSFIFQNGPVSITPTITNVGTAYTAIFNGVPLQQKYSPFTITASCAGITSVASADVLDFRSFYPFNATLSAVCSQNGTTNLATATYTVNDPSVVFTVGGNIGNIKNPVTINYSGTGSFPAITTASAGYAGTYSVFWWGKYTGISNLIPSSFTQFVVPPTNVTTTASGTTLTVKWTDSTTANCTYTVSGSPGTFTSNVASGSGTTGVQFTGATIGSGYTFIVTASSSGNYTASRFYQPDGGSIVTTENTTISYVITSASVPSTSATPIAAPTGFTALATGTNIVVSWGSVTGATSYNVLNAGTSILTVNSPTLTSNYTGVVGRTDTITVQAVGANCSNTSTSIVSVIPVSAPTITSIIQTGTIITVNSTAPGGGITLSINKPTGLDTPTGSATFVFGGATGDSNYSFTVSANGTNSVASTISSITTFPAPTIGTTFATGTSTITTNWTYTGTATPSKYQVYANDAFVSNILHPTTTCIFNQTVGKSSYAVYVVANDATRTSVSSGISNVTDIATAPTITTVTANALSFTVGWSYTGNAISNFQVWNSAQTVSYGSPVAYVTSPTTYTAPVFNVASSGTYAFVVVAKDSAGNTLASSASTGVTTVAAPVITSILQNISTITVVATGTSVSIPTPPSGLSTVSTTSPFVFTGIAASTAYTFAVQANGTNASNSSNSTFTTLATPGVPTITASGTVITFIFSEYTPTTSAFEIWNDTLTVSYGTTAASDTSARITGVVGTSYSFKLTASSAGSMSIASVSSVPIIPVAAPIITSIVQTGANIMVSCTPVSISTTNTSTCNIVFSSVTVPGLYSYPLTDFIGPVSVSATIIGGGAGGAGSGVGFGGGGGGSGGVQTTTCGFVSGIISYTIGAPGAGGAAGASLTVGSSGTAGGNSSVTMNGVVTTAGGGVGGNGNTAGGAGGTGGFAGGVGWAVTSAGGGGGGGILGKGGAGTATTGGLGGAGGGGTGGNMYAAQQPGSSGTSAGGGGGGAGFSSGGYGKGGGGFPGSVILTLSGKQSGSPLSIPTPPTGLTLVSSTSASFTYTNYTPGSTYTFLVNETGVNASNVTSSNITTLYTPGTPTVTSAGTSVTATWSYAGTYTGVTFLVRDSGNVWTGSNVTGVLTTTFTGTIGTTYTIYVSASAAGNTTISSATTSILPVGNLAFSQNYELTTQTKIVGVASGTGTNTYSATGGSLSAPTTSGGTLTWTGATAGGLYTGITIQGTGTAGASVSLINQSIQAAMNPSDLGTGLQVWYDGKDPNGNGTVAGNTITTWTNKGAGGATYNAVLVSGATAANYSSATGILGFSKSVYSTGYQRPTQFSETLFIVFNIPNPSSTLNNYTVIGSDSANGARGITVGYASGYGVTPPSSTIVTGGNGSVGISKISQPTNAVASPVSSYISGSTGIVTSQVDSTGTGSTFISLNGGTVTTLASSANFGPGYTYIGQASSSATTYSGSVMEILIYSTVLSGAAQSKVQGYLAWKWGIQANLPSTHTYKSAPPHV